MRNHPQLLRPCRHCLCFFCVVFAPVNWCAANTVSFSNYVAYPTGSWPEAVAITDFNGDGRNDLVMCTSFYSNTNDNSILVFFQNPSGGLNPPVRYAVGAAAT